MPKSQVLNLSNNVQVELLSTNEDVQRAIEKTAESMMQFAPAVIIIDSPYANYLEKGTGPASKDFLRKVDEFGRTPSERIEAWANARLTTLSPTKRKQMSYLIYRKIMEKGTVPHPFIRPAVSDTLRTLDPDWYLKGKSTFDLAKKMTSRMKRNLSRDPETGESHIYTYALYNSIRVEYDMAHVKQRVKSVRAQDLEDDSNATREFNEMLE